MRRFFYIVTILLFCCGIYFTLTNKESSAKKKNADYAKIEMVKDTMEKLSITRSIVHHGEQHNWYIFDIRVIYEIDQNVFYKILRQELGENFDSQLSNGDYLFVGVSPRKQEYKIFAGDPKKEDNLLYPEWNYTKLEKRR